MDSESTDEAPFVTIKSKKLRKNVPQQLLLPPCKSLELSEDHEPNKEYFKKRILTCKQELIDSGYFNRFLNVFRESLNELYSDLDSNVQAEIVCYGLGRLSHCPIARYQSGLLLCIKEALSDKRCLAYDPIFNLVDRDIIEEFGIDLIDFNEEGKRVANCLTIFYMPHCPKALINNVLLANWSLEQLQKCVIITNSFQEIYNSTSCRELHREFWHILTVSGGVIEYDIPDSFRHNDIFNNTAIHVFPAYKLNQLPAAHWKHSHICSYDIKSRGDFISNH